MITLQSPYKQWATVQQFFSLAQSGAVVIKQEGVSKQK